MWQKLSYKRKLIAMLVAGTLVVVITYRVSISKTIELAANCDELRDQLEIAVNAPERTKHLRAEITRLEKLIGNEGHRNIHHVRLQEVSKYCEDNGLLLKEFPEPVVRREQNYLIETTPIIVEGSLVPLVKLLYQLEQVSRRGEVVSVHFQTNKDVKTKRLVLTATIYMQNAKKDIHES